MVRKMPQWAGDIGTRINEAVHSGGTGSIKRTMTLCGIRSTGGLHAVTSGESRPGIDFVVGIAKATGFSVLWLATGEGPKRNSEIAALPSGGWPKERIIGELKARGLSLSELGRREGVSAAAAVQVLRQRSYRFERIIADVCGVTPRDIWPDRYDASGQAISRNKRKTPRYHISRAEPTPPQARPSFFARLFRR